MVKNYFQQRTPILLSAFHLLELTGQTGQFVNRMRYLEGMVLQNLRNNHSENATSYFEEIRRP